jgi:hypothetical protein
LESIIEVDDFIGRVGVEGQEGLQRLLQDLINLGSGGVVRRVEPEAIHLFVGRDNVIKSRNDIIGSKTCIPTGLEKMAVICS